MSLFQKSTIKRRTTVNRTRNNGEWTEARYVAFVKGALRGAMWPPKYTCIAKAFVGHGVNPATNRKCKMYKCASCAASFPAKQMKADHITPVVGPEGFVDWNTFIARLYVEADGFQAVCEVCHNKKTKEEREARKNHNNEH
jgi:5-methylcytosine-specific restriction endonuclease McrA